MPRTVDHIVATHHIARERVAAGQSVWARTVDLRGVYHSDTLDFAGRRDAVAARLRTTPWFKGADEHELDGVRDVVESLAAAEDQEEFNGWMDDLYDLADYDRVWIKTR